MLGIFYIKKIEIMDITNWETIELNDFKFPHKSLFNVEYQPYVLYDNYDNVFIYIFYSEISGEVIDNGKTILVKSIDISGKDSGFALIEMFDPIFEYSSGTMIADIKWSMSKDYKRLSIIDGVIKTEPIINKQIISKLGHKPNDNPKPDGTTMS